MVGRSPCCSHEPDPEVGLSGSCFCTKCPTVNQFFLCFDGPVGYPGAPNTETYLPVPIKHNVRLDGWVDSCSPGDTSVYPPITTTCGDRGSAFDGPVILDRISINHSSVTMNRCNCGYAKVMGDLQIKNNPVNYYNSAHTQ